MLQRIKDVPDGSLVQVTGIKMGDAANGNSVLLLTPNPKPHSNQWAIYEETEVVVLSGPLQPDDLAVLRATSDARKRKHR